MPSIRCPHCQTRYKVAESAAGRRTKCRRCDKAFKIPAFESQEPTTYEVSALEALADGETVEAPDAPPTKAPMPATDAAAAVHYAPSEKAADEQNARGAYGRYIRSVVKSLAFPANPGDLATFGIVCVILVIGAAVGTIGMFMAPFAVFIVTSWYWSFKLNIVLGAAGGEDDLPTLALTGGWMDDIIIPFVKMLLATIASQFPAAGFFAAAALRDGLAWQDALEQAGRLLFNNYDVLVDYPDPQVQIIGALLVIAGYFVWPMLVLVIAGAGFGGIFRPDLIVTTIAKAFPSYLLVVAAVYGSLAVAIVGAIIVSVAGMGGSILTKDVTPLLLLPAILGLLRVYTDIIAMRAIGLHYHHFRHQYAWNWG